MGRAGDVFRRIVADREPREDTSRLDEADGVVADRSRPDPNANKPKGGNR